MMWTQRLAFLLTLLACVSCTVLSDAVNSLRECPCDSASLCLPLGEAALLYPEEPHVTTYLQKKDQPELFAFALLPCERWVWEQFDWATLTTLAVVGEEDQDLLCHAHSHGVRVVPMARDYPAPDQMTNATARGEFVARWTQYVLDHGLDGVNMDFETPLGWGSPEEQGYTALIQELTTSVHDAVTDSQVSVDLGAWFFYNLRHYDGAAIAEAADLIFVMAYDAKWQGCRGPMCIAGANSHLERTRLGLHAYFRQGVPPHKLVLGMPWYGFRYVCAEYHEDGKCRYNESGTQIVYEEMMEMIQDSGVTPMWDDFSMSPYASIQESDGSWTQLWYDDPASLALKTRMAADEGLRGTGVWTANFLDYGRTPEAEAMRALMWGAMVSNDWNTTRTTNH